MTIEPPCRRGPPFRPRPRDGPGSDRRRRLVGRRSRRWRADDPETHGSGPALDPVCPLCGRSIPPRARSSLHHLTPKLKGGTHRGTVRLHQICHSAIHARYSEAEIAGRLADIEALRADPEIARFIAWVRTKPDDFHAATRMTRDRRAGRRRD